MTKYLRYKGEFLSRAGVVWRVEILQDADTAFATVGELTFPGDDPLTIEWSPKGKEEVICGSVATLRIESPGDRTYEDLYTITPGRIRMDVYRDDALYWSGALDPEFYEEPYEKAALYDVALTFSDFGILDRIKYDQEGDRTLYDIVSYCIDRAGVVSALDESLISTRLTADGNKMSLSDIMVSSDNFYDEDGEALTLREVAEGVLQPLALRMVQRSGRIYVYDLNALYNATTHPVNWDGDTQTMGTDKVYNNVKITWSTYARSGNLTNKECWAFDDVYGLTDDAYNELDGAYSPAPDGGAVGSGITSFSYSSATTWEEWREDIAIGFTLKTSPTGIGAELLHNSVRYYKIQPGYDGDSSEGVAVAWPGVTLRRSSDDPFDYNNTIGWKLHGVGKDALFGNTSSAGVALFRGGTVTVPQVASPSKLLLRVSMRLLLDPRFNPFVSSVNWPGVPQADWEEAWDRFGAFLYIPVRIKFVANNGDVYYWDNRSYISSTQYPIQDFLLTRGAWDKVGTGSPLPWGYLCYYKIDNRGNYLEDNQGKSGAIGGCVNRPAINPHSSKLKMSLEKIQDGQYIPYPPTGGKISVEVFGGWVAAGADFKPDDSGSTGDMGLLRGTAIAGARNLRNKFCWALCELPEIEIVNNRPLSLEIDTDDVEYDAEINADAKDDIEIETICGSRAGGAPTARGAYFIASTGEQVTALTRAGRTSQVEDLLIGTLFSQFGSRRTTLSGEMEILANPLSALTEQNQEGKKFIVTSDVQNVINDTSDAVITELRPDEYVKRGT